MKAATTTVEAEAEEAKEYVAKGMLNKFIKAQKDLDVVMASADKLKFDKAAGSAPSFLGLPAWVVFLGRDVLKCAPNFQNHS